MDWAADLAVVLRIRSWGEGADVPTLRAGLFGWVFAHHGSDLRLSRPLALHVLHHEAPEVRGPAAAEVLSLCVEVLHQIGSELNGHRLLSLSGGPGGHGVAVGVFPQCRGCRIGTTWVTMHKPPPQAPLHGEASHCPDRAVYAEGPCNALHGLASHLHWSHRGLPLAPTREAWGTGRQ